MYDVVIIGAGVSGCAVARELSRYKLDICVLEKETDVCEGTSKANSGIVHGGFDAPIGSLKAKLNVRGNRMMGEMAAKLDFPFKRNGSMVVCQSEEEVPKLQELLERGHVNGVDGLEILSREEALKLEPNLADSVYAVLRIPSGGIVCPFSMNIAYAENAAVNGVEFKLNTTVLDIKKGEQGYMLHTSQGDVSAKVVVNAAGVYADVFHNMVSEDRISIVARKGEYCLFDKSVGDLVYHTIFQLPSKMGKGVLVTPTVHGNLLMGPTAVDIEDKDGVNTTADGLATLQKMAELSVNTIPRRQVITSFAGLRAHDDRGDFIIGEAADAKGFIDVAGIESPGLSSAPAVGLYVRDIVAGILELTEKEDFIETRKGIVDFDSLSKEEQKKLIAENPAYGKIVCRCETVTEGEVLDAIHRPLGATTLDGVKRRTRAGMGRCQAGFCTPRTMEILARECGTEFADIRNTAMASGLTRRTHTDNL
ncbi:MAG: NAD(P)/FAD-dependent oxidoreductase [Lachnospiraceae bacterium]|nr:NAD(P)/FAD-dependent oxidoreductase [Lachnospiraceae bacterium]